MASLPPKIDQRSYEKIVSQTEASVVEFTEWTPAPDHKNDAGRALIRIFGRMAKLVSDRLNQVPDKNFLAFLDLIGGRLNPPEPARVPLTFYLAESSPTDALVPAYTQVSAPPPEGETAEIIFETDRELVATTAQLQAVFVRDSDSDRYSDRTLSATGKVDQAFLAFTGDRPIQHCLYITCPEILGLPKLSTFTLAIETNSTQAATQFSQLPLIWSYWDGSQWQGLSPNLPISPITNNQFQLTFSNLPTLSSTEIQGKSAKWLQASLNPIAANLPTVSKITGSTAIEQGNLVPETCLYNGIPLDLTKDFYPFGEEPQTNDTFYLLLQSDLIKPKAIVTLNVNLSRKPADLTDLTIAWEIANGQQWEEIGTTANKVCWIEKFRPIQFTETTPIQAKFRFPAQIPLPSVVNGTVGYWIRARIIQGYYGKKAQARKYPLYNDLAILKADATKGSKIVVLDNVDGLLEGDVIRIQPNTGGFPEENTIDKIDAPTVTLKNGLLNENINLKIGTRIFRKLMITETVSPTYDPPVIKSLTVTYKFTLQEDAIYSASNDFNDYQNQPFTTTLKRAAVKDTKNLQLNTIDGLVVGEFLTINNAETYQIASIAIESCQVWLTEKLSNSYAQDIPINRYFRPFTPTPDREPTLYLGFDQSFNNKMVTLYAQVNPPLPNELSQDITSEIALKVAASIGAKTLQFTSINGWQVGDRLEIQTTAQGKQYDSYVITNINIINNELTEITVKQPLKQNYLKGNQVIHQTQPQLVWEYSSPMGWQPLGIEDETKAFSQRGLIQFVAPADFRQQKTFDQELYWLRVRWQGGNFRVRPRLHRILTNTIWAVQASTLKAEILGSSNNDPHQIFYTSHAPVLAGQRLEVQEGQIPLLLDADRVKVIQNNLGEIEEVWVSWIEVADFYASKSSDRHYILDHQIGQVQFGNGQSGMIPPRGRNNIRLSLYRTGGGKQGNVDAQTINQLKTTVPYIAQVINLEDSGGGTNQEDLERLKARVPKQLRHRNRAVTLQDVEDLAYEASIDVARVKLITPDIITSGFSALNENFWLDPNKPEVTYEEVLAAKLGKVMESERADLELTMQQINSYAGQVKLIVLPYSSDRQPTPSLALLEKVETYIRERCDPTMDLIVTGPQWQEVTVTAAISTVSLQGADLLRDQVNQRLAKFLHPLTGGRGDGWRFGRYPQKSDLYALIQSIAGIDHVDSLETEALSSLAANSLIYSGNHSITISSLGGHYL